ncbi:MAG TPA: hypothetical protein PK990_09845 [Salinivirgaceae bacterium]|nr:hypothetical protein [Salinivirgaceae bacterium]
MKGIIAYSSPVNVSLIKNFGSYRRRYTGSPSISITLDKLRSETWVMYHYDSSKHFSVNAKINGVESEYLIRRVKNWFHKASAIFPWITNTEFEISVNIDEQQIPFVGIYTAMTSLSFCVAEIASRLGKFDEKSNLQTISSLALLDSENAARSVFGGFVSVGKTDVLPWSSDKYATPYQRGALIFDKLLVTTLVFDDTQEIPNADILTNHPYMEVRQKHAHSNFNRFLHALDEGQWDVFESISENEALTHAGLLISAENSNFLPSAQLIDTIRRLRDFRSECECPVTFTFDRELRLHLLYPPIAKDNLLNFLSKMKTDHIKIFYDSIGKKSPTKIKDELQ